MSPATLLIIMWNDIIIKDFRWADDSPVVVNQDHAELMISIPLMAFNALAIGATRWCKLMEDLVRFFNNLWFCIKVGYRYEREVVHESTGIILHYIFFYLKNFFRSLGTWSGAQEPKEEQRCLMKSSGALTGAQELWQVLRKLIISLGTWSQMHIINSLIIHLNINFCELKTF